MHNLQLAVSKGKARPKETQSVKDERQSSGTETIFFFFKSTIIHKLAEVIVIVSVSLLHISEGSGSFSNRDHQRISKVFSLYFSFSLVFSFSLSLSSKKSNENS